MHPLISILCVVPIFGGSWILRRRKLWKHLEAHLAASDYSEAKRAKSSVRNPTNAWTALSYWYAGLYTLEVTLFRQRERPLNCAGNLPHWHIAIGVALLWVGASTFLFHASLSERWRWLSSGAAMGTASLPVVFTGFRSLQKLDDEPRFMLIALGAFAGCHVIAWRSGYVSTVLRLNLTFTLAVEWSTMRKIQTEDAKVAWVLAVGLLLLGWTLHACDVYKRKLPGRSLATHAAWLGHPAWHVLSAVGVALLVSGGRAVEEKWCTKR